MFPMSSMLSFTEIQAHSCEEVEDFVKIASALLVNIGTVTSDWVSSKKLAANAANFLGKPWVLDPVGCGATPFRTKVCKEMFELKPWIVRGNASEIMSLAGVAEGPTRGVDTTSATTDAIAAAVALAKAGDCVVAVSGAVDVVTDGSTIVEVHNGIAMMADITGTGCSVTAICAAFCAVLPKERALEAAAYGLACLGVAAERAMASGNVRGPASLRVAMVDELYNLDEKAMLGEICNGKGPRVRLVQRSVSEKCNI